jgi:integrase
MTDADRGILPSPTTLTVERYLSAWLTDSIEGKLARASHEAYKRDVRHHIIPSLGRRKLKDLSTPDLRRFYRKKRDEGLSNRSLEYIHTTLRKALQDAKNDGIITRNPTDGVKPHKTPQGTAKESEALDPVQVQALL